MAAEPVVQKFGDWTVTIQPGPRGISPRDHISRTVIRPVSQTETKPADAAAVSPAGTGSDVVPLPAPAAPCATAATPGAVKLYSQVYDAIPFSRAEYEANPSYRHDATMEFLFGQMRPTVIHRGTTAVRANNWMTSAYPYAYGYGHGGYNTYYNPIFSTPYASPYYYGMYRPYSLW